MLIHIQLLVIYNFINISVLVLTSIHYKQASMIQEVVQLNMRISTCLQAMTSSEKTDLIMLSHTHYPQPMVIQVKCPFICIAIYLTDLLHCSLIHS